MVKEYNDANLNENLNDPAEKVSLEDSESMVNEYNDANLNENLIDPIEKVSNNVNSNNVIPRLPDIEIDVPMEHFLWKLSESINDTYSDQNINSDSDGPKLPNIKVEIMTEAKLSEERHDNIINLIQSQNVEKAQSDNIVQIEKISLEHS